MKKLNIFLLILIVIGLGLIVTQKKWVPVLVDYIISKESEAVAYKDGYKWSGYISNVSTDCLFDGVCSVTVAGKRVIVDGGRMIGRAEMEVGYLANIDSISDLEKNIADMAEVYANKTDGNDFTLYGKSEYYIKLLK